MALSWRIFLISLLIAILALTSLSFVVSSWVNDMLRETSLRRLADSVNRKTRLLQRSLDILKSDVLVLAEQVEGASQGSLRSRGLIYVIAAGVGVFTAIGLLRVVMGFSMAALLGGVYAVMLLLSLLAPGSLIPLAYDAGSVTTGVLTAPVVLALALGLASVLAERSAVDDGFGLLGLASVGPIIAVLLLGLFL